MYGSRDVPDRALGSKASKGSPFFISLPLAVTYNLPKVPFNSKALKCRKAVKVQKVGKYYVANVFSMKNKVN